MPKHPPVPYGPSLLRWLALVGTVLPIALSAHAHVVPPWVEHEFPSLARGSTAEPERAVARAQVGAEAVSVSWVRAVPVLQDVGGSRVQTIEFNVSNSGSLVDVRIGVAGGVTEVHMIGAGEHRLALLLPAVSQTEFVDVVLEVDGQASIEETIEVGPVRPWEVYLLPHSHVDIGFTHPQDEVEQQNWEFYETSIARSRETASYPEGSVFKWNVEILWAVESYLAQATPEKVAEFVEAVENGWVGLDALYANMLTGLMSREELVHMLDAARALRETYGFSIDSAMITDLPGYTWGTVPVLANSGIRYWSIGANKVRAGNFHRSWDDRPFYWVGPSGEEEVLTWSSSAGYTFFVLQFLRSGERIVDHLYELEQSGYPYDLTYLRYAIFDNFGPDPVVADVVRDWNATHVSPKLVLATTREPFVALEARYGDVIPRVHGDFTGYWEDGAASSARETGANRLSAERLVQAERLWSMVDPTGIPADDFGTAWRNTLLFDEHTWGSFWSVIDPEHPDVPAIWDVKKGYAETAETLSLALLDGATAKVKSDSATVSAVRVFNTSSWPRTELVEVPGEWTRAGDAVRDAEGRRVASQVLSTGSLAFLAGNVPGLGSATFSLSSGAASARGATATASGVTLSNATTRVTLDPASGAISGLVASDIPVDLAASGGGNGLNDYLYVDGRDPTAPEGVGPVTISVLESGPLVASLRIDSEAAGAASLRRVVRLVSGLDHVEITNMIDKMEIFDPEAVRIAFPFNVPNGAARLDVPWSVIEPDLDQIDGANKNVFTAESWLDVSNDEYGVTFTALDAPLVELGSRNVDPEVVGYLEEVGPTTVAYSLAMHNYWELNYRAAQEGSTLLRYALWPHGPFDAAAAARFGEAQRQPLVIVPVNDRLPDEGLLELRPSDDVLVSALKPAADGDGWVLRLFGASGEEREVDLIWKTGPVTLHQSDLGEVPGSALPDGPLHVPAYGMVTVVAKPKPEPVLPLPQNGKLSACLEPRGGIRYIFPVDTSFARFKSFVREVADDTNGSLQLALELISPDGSVQALGHPSKSARPARSKVSLLTRGDYTLRVSDAAASGGCFTGRARVSDEGRRKARVEDCVPEDGETEIAFDVLEPALLRVRLIGKDLRDPTFAVVAPSGARSDFAGGKKRVTIDGHALDETGRYRLVVESQSADGGCFRAKLTLR